MIEVLSDSKVLSKKTFLSEEKALKYIKELEDNKHAYRLTISTNVETYSGSEE